MNKKQKITKFQKVYLLKKQGFSLAEALIAAFLLTVGLITVIGLISSSMRSSIISREQVVATELVQEGLELVRNVRDNNQAQIIKGLPFTPADVFKNIPNKDNCVIDKNFSYGTDIDSNCSNSNTFVLKWDGNYFVHGGSGTDTKFARRIKIEDFDNGSTHVGRKITSMVTWNNTVPDINNPSSCNVANKCVWAATILTDRTI